MSYMSISFDEPTDIFWTVPHLFLINFEDVYTLFKIKITHLLLKLFKIKISIVA